jgi:protease-4
VRSIEELRRQLRALAQRDDVRGIVVVVDGLRISSSKRRAIGALFAEMRAAGKRVVGFGVQLDNAEYELLCAADQIVLFSGGRIDLLGFSAEATALGSGLRKLGVSAEFIRRGEFKTAPELLMRDSISPIHEETIQRLLDLRHGALVEAVSRGRRLSAEEARQKIDGGPYSARRALAKGLCDGLSHLEDLPAYLGQHPVANPTPSKKEVGIGSFSSYSRASLRAPFPWKSWRAAPRVGRVLLEGMIVAGERGRLPMGPALAGSENLARLLKAAAEDRRCQALVIQIASPGGSALASELILEAIRRAAKKKPVIAYVDQVAASGGYLCALGAQEIWSAPEAILGSIGVFAGKFEVSGLLNRLGVHRSVFQRGENAALFSPSRPFTPSERRALEGEVEETYQDFLQHVAEARKMSKEEAHRIGEGRVFSGREADQRRLVDRLGSFEESCRRALELAGEPKPEYEVVTYGDRRPGPSVLNLMRRFLETDVYALWEPGLALSGESEMDLEAGFWEGMGPAKTALLRRWLGIASIAGAGLLVGQWGCLSTRVGGANAPGEMGSVKSPPGAKGPDEALRAFIQASESGQFELAYRLLAQPWRARYTPDQLKRDFELEPRSRDLLSRARAALAEGGTPRGDLTEYPIGNGRAVSVVREPEGFKVSALE